MRNLKFCHSPRFNSGDFFGVKNYRCHLHILFFIVLVVASGNYALAQGKIIKIEFNEKGQMTSTPPPSITTNDHIDFKVNTSLAFREERILNTYKLFQQTLNILNKKDDDNQYAVLASLGISSRNQAVVIDMIGVYSRSLVRSMSNYLDKHKTVLSKYFNVDNEKGIISGYLPESFLISPKATHEDTLDTKYKEYIIIPDLEKICFPDFIIVPRVMNFNGLNINSQCNNPFLLDKCVGDCDVIYTHGFDFTDIVDGPVKLDFELRMDNNVFEQMISVLEGVTKNDPYLSDRRIKSLKDKYADLLEFVGPHLHLSDENISQLMNYIKAREGMAKEKVSKSSVKNTVKLPSVDLSVKEIDNIKGFMGLDFSDIIADVQSPRTIARLLGLSWLSGGQNITSNPLIWDTSIKPDEQLAKNNQQIKSLQHDSVQIAQQLSLLENVSKSANSVSGLLSLTTKYNALLAKKKTNDADLQTIRDANKKIKTPKPDPFVAEIKKMFAASDSLFYKGFFYVNFQAPKKTKGFWNLKPDVRDNIYHPNYLNYAFIRNHNALEDYELKGKQPIRGINETQRLFIIVDNAQDKSKILAKTTYTDIKLADDHDLFELNEVEVSLITIKKTDSLKAEALDKLYTSYETYKGLKDNIFSPYGDGVLTIPVQRISDKTPDYVSKLVSHQGPFNAPSSVSYQLLDSATNKNLSAEGNTYTYRFNKLYRFRIKAGITYSWLQNRNYTINTTTNTATYSNNYTGLAPSVGVQIFTSRLDIQNTRIFPHGAAPYVYLGYLYSGAPAANILLGGGWEVFSGVAITSGIHLGKSQSLTLVGGTLQEKDIYKGAAFVSLNIGLEAFNAIFNTAKPTVNPFKQ